MKHSVSTRVRLSEDAKRRLPERTRDPEHVRVVREDRAGVVIQWISEAMQPTGYLVDFEGIYMALAEEDLVAVE